MNTNNMSKAEFDEMRSLATFIIKAAALAIGSYEMNPSKIDEVDAIERTCAILADWHVTAIREDEVAPEVRRQLALMRGVENPTHAEMVNAIARNTTIVLDNFKKAHGFTYNVDDLVTATMQAMRFNGYPVDLFSDMLFWKEARKQMFHADNGERVNKLVTSNTRLAHDLVVAAVHAGTDVRFTVLANGDYEIETRYNVLTRVTGKYNVNVHVPTYPEKGGN